MREQRVRQQVVVTADGPVLVSGPVEIGQPDGRRMHSRLFAAMMAALGLSTAYGHYLDAAPAETLAEVNFMSMCGLHRRLRGALVGQFATVELTSSPGSERLVRALRRLGCPKEAVAFYDEHVEADAVHEQVVRHGVVAPLLAAEPELAADALRQPLADAPVLVGSAR